MIFLGEREGGREGGTGEKGGREGRKEVKGGENQWIDKMTGGGGEMSTAGTCCPMTGGSADTPLTHTTPIPYRASDRLVEMETFPNNDAKQPSLWEKVRIDPCPF